MKGGAPEERIPETVFWDLAYLVALHARLQRADLFDPAVGAAIDANRAVADRQKRMNSTPAA